MHKDKCNLRCTQNIIFFSTIGSKETRTTKLVVANVTKGKKKKKKKARKKRRRGED